jgi:hypothetical protein
MAATPISEVFMDLDHIHKADASNGDTWDPFWADDGQLYAFNCDGRGFGKQARNLAFNELLGDTPEKLTGRIINSMDEYGRGSQRGPDRATWKALGQECIDGVFYCFVSRHTYGNESKDEYLRQTAINASLIKSTDRGLTWTRTAAENYAHPMWPGGRFGAPYFIHYGQNGGSDANDAADQFVYAISNNGFWDDGDDYILGRAPRNKIANLNASDWSYYTGGDGLSAQNWSGDISNAVPILKAPRRCSTTAPCYIPALRVYLTAVWYTAGKLPSWFQPNEMRCDFYQAEHPWGPWMYINTCSDKFLSPPGHLYGPNICAKFQEKIGNGVRVWMFNSGCPFKDAPEGLYKLWEIPLVLRTGPLPNVTWINDGGRAVVYRGSWVASRQRGFSDYKDDVHYTTAVGDSVQCKFDGTGVEYITEKSGEQGRVDVYLDGKLKQHLNLQTTNFPRISQVTVFRMTDLPRGPHVIKLVNRGGGAAVLNGFKVLDASP